MSAKTTKATFAPVPGRASVPGQAPAVGMDSADDRDEPGPSPGEMDNRFERAADPAGYGSDSRAIELDVCPAVSARLELPWLRDRIVAASRTAGFLIERLTVRIVDDEEMRTLHRRHLRIDEPTDVLTFASSAAGEAIDADMAVCADEAARRSRELGHSIERELLLYIVHGLLHAAGMDDRDDAGFQRMHDEEDRILRAIGVGTTFRTVDESGDGRGNRGDRGLSK